MILNSNRPIYKAMSSLFSAGVMFGLATLYKDLEQTLAEIPRCTLLSVSSGLRIGLVQAALP